MPFKNPEQERARCKRYYAANAERLRQKRMDRYYANVDHERATAAKRKRGRPRPYKPRPPEKRVNALMKMDDRWSRWAHEVGVVL